MQRAPDPPATRSAAGHGSTLRIATGVLLLAAVIAGIVAWRLTPLAQLADPAVVTGWRDRVRDLPAAPLAVVAVFVAAGFVGTPSTLLIGATTLLFGPLAGACYAWLAMLASGSVIFAIARGAARGSVDRWLAARAGSRFDTFGRSLERRGLVAVALMRLTPLPFTLQNVLAGALRIRYADFVAGTAIGILPVIALMAGVTTEFDAWLAHPEWRRLALFAFALLVALAIGWWLTRWAARRSARR
jgi:phospholipase D1/2